MLTADQFSRRVARDYPGASLQSDCARRPPNRRLGRRVFLLTAPLMRFLGVEDENREAG